MVLIGKILARANRIAKFGNFVDFPVSLKNEGHELSLMIVNFIIIGFILFWVPYLYKLDLKIMSK